jgi:hypothetical protein
MKSINIVILLVLLLSSCAPVATAIPSLTPSPTQTATLTPTNTPTPTSTATSTLTPTLLPITFKYQDSIPANARGIQEQAMNKAYRYFSQYTDLGPITVYTFYDISLVMDEIYSDINADEKIDISVFRKDWAAGLSGGGASDDTVIINPNHLNWKDSGCYKPKNIIHETFHMVQAKLMQTHSLPADEISYSPEWLNEGSAEVIGHFLADGIGGCSYQDRVKFWIETTSDKVVSLKEIEASSSKEWFWSTAPLAVVQLIQNSPDKEKSLFKYYSELGSGKDWHDAFNSAFGLSVEEFYEQFDTYYQSIKLTLDMSVCLLQSDSRIKCLGRKPSHAGFVYLFSIPFGFNTPPDKWTQEATCVLAPQGYEGTTSAVTFQVYIEKSVHGTCHAAFKSGEGKRFSVDFLAP